MSSDEEILPIVDETVETVKGADEAGTVGGSEDTNDLAQETTETNEDEAEDGPKDNPDDLVERRGEGRYFGHMEEKAPVICTNCHRRGHMRANCKVVVCNACGMVDDHYESQCPQSIVCTNCGEKGHFQRQCTQPRKRIYCTECGLHSHSSDRCPRIWRTYLTSRTYEPGRELPPLYCYNCASSEHYGDDCRQPRQSRTPNINGSAFKGSNLPRQARDMYQRKQRKRTFEGDQSGSKRPRHATSVPNFNNRNSYNNSYGNGDNGRGNYNSNYSNNNNNNSSYNSNYNSNYNNSGSSLGGHSIAPNRGKRQPSKSGTLAPPRGGVFAGAKSRFKDAKKKAGRFFN
ncbi:unnamed protein product [Kuraishia capsulata CBS 1993]|uniref:CCHC-type domain-containing protein n=1 Tax=Kuraishia capsulata CBS 1993 TaxID=1382522 RepID=W6MLV4_9ASCO|nr:uncharacterized protein KUCA_T00001833001 [Kuraishia capsulata CBS 1993]CDK25862.1 unnamed protein product [Kuraishia capsulata CBS 1993]